MGYRLNRLDEPVFIAVSKPLLTEFGIHHRLESCAVFQKNHGDFTIRTGFPNSSHLLPIQKPPSGYY